MWSHDELNRVQLDLLDRGVIEIGGKVEGKTALYVREALLRLVARGSPPITISICSEGGLVEVGLDIYDAFQVYPGKKIGLVVGYARSMAAVVLQACTQRIASRHAQLLIHHVSRREISLDVIQDAKRLAALKTSMEASQDRLYRILAARSGKSVAAIRRECKKGQDMTAEEALEFGLVDMVIDSQLDLSSAPKEGE
ncbi:MAG: ATP-dependent Clp protease proteolytic subunit [Patescibacteria group bacterium]|nr:ATP-dependent Clp protease proteolytic subunit [Patescibacteria group bacterium]